jgi:hypothetical protein
MAPAACRHGRGAEGIVSKRVGSAYRGGPSRDWLKAKVSKTAAFVITGFIEHEAVAVAEGRNGELAPSGLVKFGLAGGRVWIGCAPVPQAVAAWSRCAPSWSPESSSLGATGAA